MKRLASACVLAAASLLVPTLSFAAAGDDPSSLALPQTTVTAAAIVPAGTFSPPSAGGRGGRTASTAFARPPEFCRVAATLSPSDDSDIGIEVWLPTSGWNGRFQAVGTGGWAGSIAYGARAGARRRLRRRGGRPRAHRQHRRLCRRSSGEGRRSRLSRRARDGGEGQGDRRRVLRGASLVLPLERLLAGGRQGITAAVRFPGDFDAAIAGAPAVNWMHLHAGRMAANRSATATPEATIPRTKYEVIHRAVLAACDAADGVTDQVIENPLVCRFDPAVLRCRAQQADDSCLTAAQIESVRSLYAPVANARQEQVLPDLVPGSELGWAVAASPQPVATALDAFRYLLYADPAWDASRFEPVIT